MVQVSVITPCFNAARYVGEAIDSVRRQDGVTWEHVLVDDGSTDDTAGVIRAATAGDRRARLVERPNGGVAAARNDGFRAASSDSRYLLFLDSDDWLAPGMIARLAAYLDEHPEAGVAYCDPFLVDEGGNVLDWEWPARYGARLRKIKSDDPVTPFEAVYLLAGIIPSLALIRRETYERTPGWDEELGQPCEDTDLFLHLALQAQIHLVPERLAYHRVHPGQSVRDVRRLDSQHAKLCEKWQSIAVNSGPAGERIAAAHRLLRAARLTQYLTVARRHLLRGRPLTAARFAVGAARRYVLPPAGTAEAAGRAARRQRARAGSREWSP